MAIVMLPGGWVDVRAITGHDEQALGSGAGGETDSPAALLSQAITLIDRVLIARPGALVAPGDAVLLASAVRDRLLAALYHHVYGEFITSSPRCVNCGEWFELQFRLTELMQTLAFSPVPPDGVYQTAEGARFRLPTGTDEFAVLGLNPDGARRTLLARCLVDAPEEVSVWDEERIGAVERAMEAAAPLLNVDLSAVCPECGTAQQIRFDMGAYLIGRLTNDNLRLASEVHALAVTYHWGLNEILSLSRRERERYLALINADADRARLRAASTGARRRIG